MSSPTLSIIIPTLNAAASLARTLAPLVDASVGGFVKDVIVVDGGSEDPSVVVAEDAGCEIVHGEKGRSKQMNAGATRARGDWLLFLHADTELDQAWLEETLRFVAQPNAEERAAAFLFAFDDQSPAARRVEFWARLRARVLKLPYGDQGLLISRALFNQLGGFAEIPLMEDVDIVRRIGAKRLTILNAPVRTSAEKYRRDGFQKRAWRNLSLLIRYYLGAKPEVLAAAYAKEKY